MLDLSVTYNIVVLAVIAALSLVWLFFVIDISAVKKPKKALRVACLTLGIIGLVSGAAVGFVAVGLKVGFISVVGNAAEIFGSSVPQIGRFVSLFTYPIVWGTCAFFAAESLVLTIMSAVKKSADKALAADRPSEISDAAQQENADVSEIEPEPQVKPDAQSEDYRLDDVRSIMDEISGLVDSLDAEPDESETKPLPEEQPSPSETEPEIESEPQPEIESFAKPDAEQTDAIQAQEEAEEAEEEQAPQSSQEPISDEEPVSEEQPLTPAEKVETGKRRAPIAAAEINDFKEVGERPQVRTLVRQAKPSEGAKDVTPQEGGLPVTKRHVLINRRNVVNMFSDYLKSKSDDEKKRLQSSINTIIIK